MAINAERQRQTKEKTNELRLHSSEHGQADGREPAVRVEPLLQGEPLFHRRLGGGDDFRHETA